MKKSLTILITLSALLMGLSGCATTQDTRFYLLSSLPQIPAGSQVKRTKLTLGIGPINIPEYLDRPQIVTRSSRNALRLAEFHNWAEQLKSNIVQVVAENLSILLTTDQVKLYPWPLPGSIDYQVVINVIQFERNPAGNAVLLAHWSILNGRKQPVLTGRTAHITVRPQGRDYKSLAGALSEALADLSREIAGSIKSIKLKKSIKSKNQ
ncbi:MAG TPA: membrane integrity-associated transporter subunit PqiC [Desulfobacterales bacterium]|nr:membrane integrity-associated transporter subunit PqiC [Desulfobacterales bacterium]